MIRPPRRGYLLTCIDCQRDGYLPSPKPRIPVCKHCQPRRAARARAAAARARRRRLRRP